MNTARWRLLVSVIGLATVSRHLAAQAPSVTVGGVGYVQYGYQLKQDSTLIPNTSHQNNFDVTRAYVNVIGKFSHGIYTRLTLDIAARSAPGTQPNSATSQLAYRLKYGYVAWTPENSKITMKLGEIHTPWLDWEEALWDYRMQGTMAIERGGYLSSSDFGAGLDGTWSYDGVNAQIGLFNGENYSGAPGDQRKDLMGRVSVRVMKSDLPGRVGGLRLTGYGQYGKPTTGGKRERYLGMVSYKSKMWTLAAEFASTKDSTTGGTINGNPVAAVTDRTGRVISAFGVVNVPNSKVAFIARVDITDPNTGSAATNDRLTRVIGGVSYKVGDNLRVLADIDNVSRQGGGYNNAFNATRSTALLQAQLTF
jgi:hypothetical protein